MFSSQEQVFSLLLKLEMMPFRLLAYGFHYTGHPVIQMAEFLSLGWSLSTMTMKFGMVLHYAP